MAKCDFCGATVSAIGMVRHSEKCTPTLRAEVIFLKSRISELEKENKDLRDICNYFKERERKAVEQAIEICIANYWDDSASCLEERSFSKLRLMQLYESECKKGEEKET